MRIAVIDCGTNTFNLLIADKSALTFASVYCRKNVVKLGSSGLTNRVIGEIPQQKAIKTLIEFKKFCVKFNADKIIVVGTAAMRDAKNKVSFLKNIYEKTGLSVTLLTGNREARLIYAGVCNSYNIGQTPSLIIDIGGGSVEFIIGNNKKIFWKKSYRIGATRLLELFRPSNPIQISEIKELQTYFKESLCTLIEAALLFKPKRLIGSSGVFDTLACMLQNTDENDKSFNFNKHYEFKIEDYKNLYLQILTSTLTSRLSMKGMSAMRADTIVPATILISFVLKEIKLKEMHMSTYSLQEGLMLSAIRKTARNNTL